MDYKHIVIGVDGYRHIVVRVDGLQTHCYKGWWITNTLL